MNPGNNLQSAFRLIACGRSAKGRLLHAAPCSRILATLLLLAFAGGLSATRADTDPTAEPPEKTYPTSIAGATASIVSEVVSSYLVPVERLTQDEKMEIMAALNRKGVFLLKGSVSYVAKELHSSEASIYRYLGKLNNRA